MSPIQLTPSFTHPHKKRGAELYYPTEHALLCDWLGIPRPDALRHEDIHAGPPYNRGVSVGEGEEDALDVAVGKLALRVAKRRARVERSRCPRQGARRRFDPRVRPELLLTVEWYGGFASSSAEHYLLTELPAYRVKVLVMEIDDEVGYGFQTKALGVVESGNIRGSAEELISSWWERVRELGNESGWELAWPTKRISHRSARRWAREVWPHAPEDHERSWF